jgi:hypothetical protein
MPQHKKRRLERHKLVQVALVGGHGRIKPIVLIEMVNGTTQESLLDSLLPYIEKANSLRYLSVHIPSELVSLVTREKPLVKRLLVRTLKGSVARLSNLALYKKEIYDFHKRLN